MQYVAFLVEHQRLPFFEHDGGGEGGYQAQHPPLYYALMAAVHALVIDLPERWIWHILRWWTAVLVGGGVFLVCRAFFLRLWPDDPWIAFTGAAVALLMPLSVLYSGHVNPDGFAYLTVSAALYLAVVNVREAPSLRRALLLGLVLGAASLTKISALVAVIPALIAWLYLYRGERPRGWARDAVVSVALAVVIGAWWYIRNMIYYATPFIHTSPPYGSALENAFATGNFGFFAWLTLKNTFLSTWVQRGWLPEGPVEWAYYLIIGLLIVGAVAGWILSRRRDADHDRESLLRRQGAVLSIATMLAILLGQQSAFWFSDVEFNAGGRYLLMGMPGIVYLLMAGWSALVQRRHLLLIFACLAACVVVVNLLSAWQIVTVLNPTHAPGWEIFHFPPG